MDWDFFSIFVDPLYVITFYGNLENIATQNFIENLIVKFQFFFFTDLASCQGAAFKNNETTKQESHQEYYCFLEEQFYYDQ